MNLIDIVVAIVLVFGVIRGFRRGMIKEALGLAGLVIAVWAGFRLAFIFADYYKANFEIPENLLPFLAFATAFGLAIVAVLLLGKFLTRAATAASLTPLNKAGGAAFGGLKWAFLLGTLLALAGNSQVIPPGMTEGSATYPHIKKYTESVNKYTISLIPAARNVFEDMDDYFHDLDSIRKARKALPPESSPGKESPTNAPGS